MNRRSNVVTVCIQLSIGMECISQEVKYSLSGVFFPLEEREDILMSGK